MDLDGFRSWIEFGKITAAGKYAPALTIEHEGEALEHLRLCVEHTLKCRPALSYSQALAIERTKIAYFAGFHDLETRKRVERLYCCVHPYAGPADESHRARNVQLACDFSALCSLWDKQLPHAWVFGRFKQPAWRASMYKFKPV